MKTLLIINLIGLIVALIGITIFFVAWLKAERKLAELERRIELERKNVKWLFKHVLLKNEDCEV